MSKECAELASHILSQIMVRGHLLTPVPKQSLHLLSSPVLLHEKLAQQGKKGAGRASLDFKLQEVDQMASGGQALALPLLMG